MAGSDYSDDETEYESPSSQAIVLDALLTPFRVLFSKTALRIYLNIFLFGLATVVLLGVSSIAYGLFYYRFIPTVGVDREVHLQFGDGHPWGTASFGSEFVHTQPYDVAVSLDLPRTPANLDAGNFMVDLTLYSCQQGSALPNSSSSLAPILHSRRPAILTYSSPLVDLARRLLRLPLYVLGMRREAEKLEVPMGERTEFVRGACNLPQSLRLEIQSDTKLQVYSAQVEFRARFTGLRWFMYRWKVTAFVVFSSLFWSVSMASASLTWLLVNWVLQAQPESEEVKEEEHDLVKNEPEHEEYGSSGKDVEVKKEAEEQGSSSSLLQSLPAETHDGVGSGLESAEARGLQRRRSHQPGNDSDDA